MTHSIHTDFVCLVIIATRGNIPKMNCSRLFLTILGKHWIIECSLTQDCQEIFTSAGNISPCRTAAGGSSSQQEQWTAREIIVSSVQHQQPPAQPSPAQPALLWPLWFIFNDYLPTKGSSRQLHQIALLPTFRKMNKNELKRLISVYCLLHSCLCLFIFCDAFHNAVQWKQTQWLFDSLSKVTVLAWLVLCVRLSRNFVWKFGVMMMIGVELRSSSID